MLKILKRLAIAALLPTVIGFCAGCGGGPLRTGGLGVFGATVAKLPDEVVSMDELPPKVKAQTTAAISGKKLERVIRNARPSDGKWYYTITYSDKFAGTKQISFWKDGSPRALRD